MSEKQLNYFKKLKEQKNKILNYLNDDKNDEIKNSTLQTYKGYVTGEIYAADSVQLNLNQGKEVPNWMISQAIDELKADIYEIRKINNFWKKMEDF